MIEPKERAWMPAVRGMVHPGPPTGIFTGATHTSICVYYTQNQPSGVQWGLKDSMLLKSQRCVTHFIPPIRIVHFG